MLISFEIFQFTVPCSSDVDSFQPNQFTCRKSAPCYLFDFWVWKWMLIWRGTLGSCPIVVSKSVFCTFWSVLYVCSSFVWCNIPFWISWSYENRAWTLSVPYYLDVNDIQMYTVESRLLKHAITRTLGNSNRFGIHLEPYSCYEEPREREHSITRTILIVPALLVRVIGILLYYSFSMCKSFKTLRVYLLPTKMMLSVTLFCGTPL